MVQLTQTTNATPQLPLSRPYNGLPNPELISIPNSCKVVPEMVKFSVKVEA